MLRVSQLQKHVSLPIVPSNYSITGPERLTLFFFLQKQLTWQIARIFSPLVLTFFALLYAGMEVMKYAPLETFITVKSMTPVLFSTCEYLFLGRALPNLKSTAALVGIVAGAATYVKVDAYASYHAYMFCLLFLVAAVSEGLVAKTTIEKVKLNNWSRSYNINVLSIPLAAAQMLVSKEHLHFWR